VRFFIDLGTSFFFLTISYYSELTQSVMNPIQYNSLFNTLRSLQFYVKENGKFEFYIICRWRVDDLNLKDIDPISYLG